MDKTGGRLEDNPERNGSGYLRSSLDKKGLRGDLIRNTSDRQESDLQRDMTGCSFIMNEPSSNSIHESGESGFRIADTDMSDGMISMGHSGEKHEEKRGEYRLPNAEHTRVANHKPDDKPQRSGNKWIAILAITLTSIFILAISLLYRFSNKRELTSAPSNEERELTSSEIYAKVSPAIVVIEVTLADGDEVQGSGFFIDDKGTLVTNYHVIDEAVEGYVVMQKGRTHEILGIKDSDEILDLAILAVDCQGNPYLDISDKKAKTGESVYTLGAPLGLNDTFSDGIVSNASRNIDGAQCIQITAPISPGNSGGPLINSEGEVIGVNTFFYTEGQNLNFATDISELHKLNREGDPLMLPGEQNENDFQDETMD